jgi:Flp pilus assembly protein TadG
MRNSLRSMLHRLVAEVRGAEIAEAAAVLPLMFMMLLGIFWFGQAFSIYGAITRAAQEGARAGAFPHCATCGVTDSLSGFATNAVSATQNALIASKLDPNLTRISPTQAAYSTCLSTFGNPPPGCANTSLKICVQVPIQLTTPNSGATQLCGMSVSFQYPFQFWLPFTSLNKQHILLSASARVRMETR